MAAIIEDTRQQVGKHNKKRERIEAEGYTIIRSKLPVGDYALPPTIAVDTKKGLLEIANNLCGNVAERQRFIRECKAAREAGTALVFLIETGKYKRPADLIGQSITLKNGKTIPGEQVYRAIAIVTERYGVRFEFSRPSETGRRILEILGAGR